MSKDSKELLPLEPLQAAQLLCKESGWRLSHLSIQKILYIGQVIALGRPDSPSRFVDAKFEAWDYGPVIPSLYQALRTCGAGNIGDNATCWQGLPVSDTNTPWHSFVKDMAGDLSSTKPGTLVGATHARGGAWRKHYKPGVRGVEIPEDDIANDFCVVLPALFW